MKGRHSPTRTLGSGWLSSRGQDFSAFKAGAPVSVDQPQSVRLVGRWRLPAQSGNGADGGGEGFRIKIFDADEVGSA
jgi:hypothetical protein